jgi:16S rRNA (uracil1498-N3)-methyltransferase
MARISATQAKIAAIRKSSLEFFLQNSHNFSTKLTGPNIFSGSLPLLPMVFETQIIEPREIFHTKLATKMFMHRCFCDEDMAIGPLELTPRESCHLCGAARMPIGGIVEILDGKGRVARGEIVRANKKCAVVNVETISMAEIKTPHISLLQAVLANANNDHVVREATAIGASKIIFFETQNTECKLGGKVKAKLVRWRLIAIEACKQSGNPFLPKISYAERLERVELSEFDARLFGGLSVEAVPLKLAFDEDFSFQKICVAVGPEGDFSPSEYDFLKNNGFQECRFSRNVLRSETAAVYALSVLDHLGRKI